MDIDNKSTYWVYFDSLLSSEKYVLVYMALVANLVKRENLKT